VDSADRAEAESIRRFTCLERLGRDVEDAARRAEARLRLELALRYGLSSNAAVRPASRQAA
jgi:hypothetical protein